MSTRPRAGVWAPARVVPGGGFRPSDSSPLFRRAVSDSRISFVAARKRFFHFSSGHVLGLLNSSSKEITLATLSGFGGRIVATCASELNDSSWVVGKPYP